jgi:hypothetical protein
MGGWFRRKNPRRFDFKERAMTKMPTTVFSSYDDVQAWVDRFGLDALRDLVYSESLRSSSQYWGSTWLASHPTSGLTCRPNTPDARTLP